MEIDINIVDLVIVFFFYISLPPANSSQFIDLPLLLIAHYVVWIRDNVDGGESGA